MSYAEFKSWQTFYMLEPFGWEDQEYRLSAILTQLHNQNATKKSQLLKPTARMRNMISLLSKGIKNKILSLNAPEIDIDTPEGKQQATETLVTKFKTLFGATVVAKDK